MDLRRTCTCGHSERDHEDYEPPYSCAHGMTVDEPDGDCDCMAYTPAVALINAHTLAELRAARDVVAEVQQHLILDQIACGICNDLVGKYLAALQEDPGGDA